MASELRWQLRREVGSVRHARSVITEHIDGAELRALAGLLVSETVTNAVLYGLDPVELRLRRVDHVLRVEVSDGDLRPPPGAGAPAVAPEGTARWLVLEALADEWGIDLRDDARVVWFEIDTSRSRRPLASS